VRLSNRTFGPSLPGIIPNNQSRGRSLPDISYRWGPKNWRMKFTPETANGYQGVAWSPTLHRLVAVATVGTTKSAYSDDGGSTWVLAATAPSGNVLHRVVWGSAANKFVAISSSAATICYSSDGITWTQSTATSRNYTDIAYSPTLNCFATISSAGVARGSYSTDGGVNFIDNAINTSTAWSGIIWAQGLNLFLAYTVGNTVATSLDGITWSAPITVSISPAAFNMSAIAWSPTLKLFCATTTSTGRAKTLLSRDGVNWFYGGYLRSASTSATRSILWAAGLNMFISFSNGNAAGFFGNACTSPDGYTWTPISFVNAVEMSSSFIRNPIYVDELGVVVTGAGTACGIMIGKP
jgi:hypothetical protein